MKTLILKLIPGVVATIAVLVGAAIYSARAQQPAAAAAPVFALPPPTAATPEPARLDAGITLCGGCGEQLQAPQIVRIAAPVAGGRPSSSFYGVPPAGYVQAPPYAVPAGYYGETAPYGYRPGAPRESAFPMTTQFRIPAHQLPPSDYYYYPAPAPHYPHGGHRAHHGHPASHHRGREYHR